MALYDFKNKDTGEVEEHLVPMKTLGQFALDHPHLERVFTPIAFSQRINVRRDSGFQEVLQKAKNAHPLGTLDV